MLTRLFPELLSYIMVLAQESIADRVIEEDDSDTELLPLQPFEIAISHVNSSIRSTALMTALLWSSIHVKTSTQSEMVIADRTATYLARSGGHLLDVRIETDKPTPTSGRLLYQAMRLIASESLRWRKLTIIAEHAGITDVIACIRERLLAGRGGLTPKLEFLSISVDYSEAGFASIQRENEDSLQVVGEGVPQVNEHMHRRVTFGQLPALSFLRLRGLAIYLFQPELLHNLRTLHLDQTKAIPLSFSFLGSIMAACPALENLSIYGDIVMPAGGGAYDGDAVMQAPMSILGGGRIQDSYHQASHTGSVRNNAARKAKQVVDKIITLPELRSLRVCGITGSVFKVLLSRLDAPKLLSFSVKDVQEHDLDALWDDPFTANRREGTRGQRIGACSSTSRFTQIRSLTINNSELSQSIYHRLFQLFPRIVEFASYSSMDLDMAPKLLADGAAGVPWPQLRTLTFIFDTDLYTDDPVLEEILRDRRDVGHPINRLRVGVTKLDEEDVQDTEEQRGIVVMESLRDIDTWPTHRRYQDVDDILFY
ncbi:hypothetical protein AN958_03508 [Leucoagaricus sp. SymC.cos]|nr:hypothetical protein AN958_03508 [Leucoagaricus sp. SymC.cos]